MRGRKPRGVELKPNDIAQLEALLRSGKTEQRTARRARILLGMHRGERVNPLSGRVEQDPSTLVRLSSRRSLACLSALRRTRAGGRV
jgi:hypothetical protein